MVMFSARFAMSRGVASTTPYLRSSPLGTSSRQLTGQLENQTTLCFFFTEYSVCMSRHKTVCGVGSVLNRELDGILHQVDRSRQIRSIRSAIR
jgi:hypothetical protein